MTGLALVAFALLYLSIWSRHEVVPNPEGAAEWRSVPATLRPLLRRGPGPVLIPSALVQLACAVMVVAGVLSLTGLLVYPLGPVLYYAIVSCWVLAAASLALVDLRARRWRRNRR